MFHEVWRGFAQRTQCIAVIAGLDIAGRDAFLLLFSFTALSYAHREASAPGSHRSSSLSCWNQKSRSYSQIPTDLRKRPLVMIAATPLLSQAFCELLASAWGIKSFDAISCNNSPLSNTSRLISYNGSLPSNPSFQGSSFGRVSLCQAMRRSFPLVTNLRFELLFGEIWACSRRMYQKLIEWSSFVVLLSLGLLPVAEANLLGT